MGTSRSSDDLTLFKGQTNMVDGNDSRLQELLKPKKTVQLAASGPVSITELERRVIDTHDFQRLRGIRQLGTAHMVYPTALHTRYDHSLGTLQMVSEMIRLIRSNQHSGEPEKSITLEQEIVARLYALLHDITHVPHGHTVEDELRLLERHDENAARIERFLGPDSEIGNIVSTERATLHDRLLEIYRWDDKNPSKFPIDPDWVFVHDLVSNTVCADLLDYIRRDDFFCNLRIGLQYQFLNYLYLDREDKSPSSRKRVFVRLAKSEGTPRRDTLSDLCRLMEARYMIAERVYFHHAKVIAGTMLGRAIQEHIDGVLAGDQAKAEAWICSISDDELLATLRQSTAPLAKRLADQYHKRDLYKSGGSYTRADINAAQSAHHDVSIRRSLETQLTESPQTRRQIENELAEVVLANEGDVLLYAPPEKMNLKVAQMRVRWNGENCTFKDIDDPIVHTRLAAVEAAHRMLWSIRIITSPSLDQDQVARLNRYFRARFLEADEVKSHEGTDRVLREVIEDFMVRENVRQPQDPAQRRDKLNRVVASLVGGFRKGGPSRSRLRSAINEEFGSGV